VWTPLATVSDVDWRISRLLILVAAGLGALAAVVIGAYYVGPLARWDAAALHGMRALAHDHATLGATAGRIAHLGDPVPTLVALAAICALGLAVGRRRQAFAAAMIVGVANVATQGLKLALSHPRYQPVLGFQLPATAFPSGHATATMSVALAAILVAPRRWRPLATICGTAFTLCVSISLLGDGWHYPSDVLGGFLVAGPASLLVLAGLHTYEAIALRRGVPIQGKVASQGAGLPPIEIGAIVATGAVAAVLALAHRSAMASFAAANTSAAVAAIGIAIAALVMVYGLRAQLEAG
jgi:membrane-associated phospholipid phosphatase